MLKQIVACMFIVNSERLVNKKYAKMKGRAWSIIAYSNKSNESLKF